MTTETLTLTDFLLARIAEDEAAAQAALVRSGGEWVAEELAPHNGDRVAGTVEPASPRSYPGWFGLWDDETAIGMWPETAAHVALHDPARVLAECEAKRRIVEQASCVLESWSAAHGGPGRLLWDDVTRRERSHAASLLDTLASVYADHPEFREEWR